jgi:formate hydrogenlyase subunit 3/multisubunit Na+/H+ antiporter MnhD subunit
MRLMSAMFVRVGLAMLVLGLLVRLMPIPNRADVVADDLAIAVSVLLILVASVYLRLSRRADRAADQGHGGQGAF